MARGGVPEGGEAPAGLPRPPGRRAGGGDKEREGGVRAARPGNAASALPRVSSPRVGRGAAGKEGGAGLGAGPREGLGASRGLRGGFAGVSAERRSRG